MHLPLSSPPSLSPPPLPLSFPAPIHTHTHSHKQIHAEQRTGAVGAELLAAGSGGRGGSEEVGPERLPGNGLRHDDRHKQQGHQVLCNDGWGEGVQLRWQCPTGREEEGEFILHTVRSVETTPTECQKSQPEQHVHVQHMYILVYCIVENLGEVFT